MATRILLNARLQEGIKRINEKEFDEKVGNVIEEALLGEYFEKEKQLELSINAEEQLKKEIGERKKEGEKQSVFLKELKGEIKSLKRSSNIAYSVGIATLMLFSVLSLNWNSLSTLSFVLVIIGLIAGGISIIGFMKNWRLAIKVVVTVATVVSLGAAILAFRTMS